MAGFEVRCCGSDRESGGSRKKASNEALASN
jgi:hypothetical protein